MIICILMVVGDKGLFIPITNNIDKKGQCQEVVNKHFCTKWGIKKKELP